uniref:HTH luxR-type domain-containing protein n=1 Tax=Caenorhabditis japonica TaxID=281687 RepID=A0A8R1IF54_CAEJA
MKSSPHRPSIELLFKRGLGSAEIARRLQISSSTVRNVVAAIKKRGDASEKRIIRNDGLSLNRMASQLGIARSTVQSIVKNDLKLKSYKLRRGQYLSDKSKAMRLEKCRKLLQHFQHMIEPVLEVVKECNGYQLDEETRQAWTVLYQVIANLIEVFRCRKLNE